MVCAGTHRKGARRQRALANLAASFDPCPLELPAAPELHCNYTSCVPVMHPLGCCRDEETNRKYNLILQTQKPFSVDQK